jgi:hypothetical protein
MTIRQLTIVVVLISPIVVFLAVYIGLVRDGTASPPDFDAIAHSIGLGTTTAAQVALALAIAVMAIMAVLAPIIFAIRANDLPTVLISIAMTGGAITMMFVSRTVMDQISALIIYLANMTLSAVVYAAHRIAPKG